MDGIRLLDGSAQKRVHGMKVSCFSKSRRVWQAATNTLSLSPIPLSRLESRQVTISYLLGTWVQYAVSTDNEGISNLARFEKRCGSSDRYCIAAWDPISKERVCSRTRRRQLTFRELFLQDCATVLSFFGVKRLIVRAARPDWPTVPESNFTLWGRPLHLARPVFDRCSSPNVPSTPCKGHFPDDAVRVQSDVDAASCRPATVGVRLVEMTEISAAPPR
jgi:hypothetical protein